MRQRAVMPFTRHWLIRFVHFKMPGCSDAEPPDVSTWVHNSTPLPWTISIRRRRAYRMCTTSTHSKRFVRIRRTLLIGKRKNVRVSTQEEGVFWEQGEFRKNASSSSSSVGNGVAAAAAVPMLARPLSTPRRWCPWSSSSRRSALCASSSGACAVRCGAVAFALSRQERVCVW